MVVEGLLLTTVSSALGCFAVFAITFGGVGSFSARLSEDCLVLIQWQEDSYLGTWKPCVLVGVWHSYGNWMALLVVFGIQIEPVGFCVC